MGVKHTVTLSRAEAEDKLVDLLQARQRRLFEAEVHLLSSQQLEDALEKLNDAAHDGEGFENYIVRDRKW